MVTCAKPWTGFMLNMFCPKVHFCPKIGLNLAKMGLFASVIQDTNVVVGLKLLTTVTDVTMVLCKQGKKLNLVLKKSE